MATSPLVAPTQGRIEEATVMNSEPIDFPIQREKCIRFRLRFFDFFLNMALGGIYLGIASAALASGNWVAVLMLLLVWLGAYFFFLRPIIRRHIKMEVDGLRYRLDGSTLRINQGLWLLQRKAIPVDRITDMSLVKNLIFDIWVLNIQTAGTGGLEARMVFLENPEEVRDQILKAKDAAK